MASRTVLASPTVCMLRLNPMKRKKSRREVQRAPGDLAVVHALLDTVDREAGRDAWKSPRALADWLAGHGLLAAGVELGAADLERLRRLRQGWRSLLAGSGDEEEVLRTLNEATAPAAFRAWHRAGGVIRYESRADGIDGAIARLVSIVSRAQTDETWGLLKICASPECRRVFYDRSTNHSAKWCRTRCGNRISSRESKRRERLLRRQYQERLNRLRGRTWR